MEINWKSQHYETRSTCDKVEEQRECQAVEEQVPRGSGGA